MSPQRKSGMSAEKAGKKLKSSGKTRACSSKDKLTKSFLGYALTAAKRVNAAAIFVYADAVGENSKELEKLPAEKVWFVTKTDAESSEQQDEGRQFIQVPNVPLTRFGQIKVAVLSALTKGLLQGDDTIVCLSGIDECHSLDTMVVINVGEEFEMFSTPTGQETVSKDFSAPVLERVIEIATALGAEGREGKPVGTIFVVGDSKKVLTFSRQLILNPFQGYPEEKRNVLDPGLTETIKELATIDGAFVLRGNGALEAAGVYLKAGATTAEELPQGLGTRHQAAAAITDITDAVAVSVSASTGNVTVYRGGRIITEIEKARGSHKT